MTHYPRYDDAARETIRRRLLDYKLAFKLGAPRLATLIEASDAHKSLVDQRRVSRFLAKQTRPDDVFIDWCRVFLETVPTTSDPQRELATALRGFRGPASPVSVEYAGTYELKSVADPQDFLVNARVSIVADDGFWRVESRNLRMRSEIYDGVLVAMPTYGLALLAHRLTGELRIYTVAVDGQGMKGTDLLFAQANRLINKPMRLERVDV